MHLGSSLESHFGGMFWGLLGRGSFGGLPGPVFEVVLEEFQGADFRVYIVANFGGPFWEHFQGPF